MMIIVRSYCVNKKFWQIDRWMNQYTIINNISDLLLFTLFSLFGLAVFLVFSLIGSDCLKQKQIYVLPEDICQYTWISVTKTDLCIIWEHLSIYMNFSNQLRPATYIFVGSKPGHGYLTTYVMVFFIFYDKRWEAIVHFVDIGQIVYNPRNENLNLLVWIKFLNLVSIYMYIY